MPASVGLAPSSPRSQAALQSSAAPSLIMARNARAPKPSAARLGRTKCGPASPTSTRPGSSQRMATSATSASTEPASSDVDRRLDTAQRQRAGTRRRAGRPG